MGKQLDLFDSNVSDTMKRYQELETFNYDNVSAETRKEIEKYLNQFKDGLPKLANNNQNSGTHIQWTHETWNPWVGCFKVSQGCSRCYFFRDGRKFGINCSEVTKSKTKFHFPLTLRQNCLVFTASWSDIFIADADEWRDDFWAIVRATPHITYQILTKRASRIKECLPDDWGKGYPNCWIGVSCENEEMTLKRIPYLLEIPAAVRFVSAEPLLSSIISEKTSSLLQQCSWIIIGGETGDDSGIFKYRPTETKWIIEIIDFCKSNNVPCFMKQMGCHLAKHFNCQDKTGGTPSQWPTMCRVREYPMYTVYEPLMGWKDES